MLAGQKAKSIALEDDVVILAGPEVEIRFPSGWARKLFPWAEGPAKNILCNPDLRRFNLQGMTKERENLVLTYVGPQGRLRAERVSRGFLPVLRGLLETGPGTTSKFYSEP